MSMHILFDSHGLNEFGESEAYKAYCIVRAATEYARVSVVLPERFLEKVPSLQRMGVNVVPVRYDNNDFPLNRELEYMYRLYSRNARSACREIIPDVDLIHRLNPMAVRYASDLGFVGRPFMIGPLGWSSLPPAWARTPAGAARNLLKRCDRARLSVPSSRLARMYRNAAAITMANGAALGPFPAPLRAKCEVVGEWIDTRDYPFAEAPNDEEPVILFVGRLIPYKGVEYLLRALARISDRRWTLRIVGDGPLEVSLKDECVELGIASRVEFVGRVPRRNVLQHYHDAAICCFPGLNESSGNVNVEAMACGRPLVVADWAGPREIVGRECGILVGVDTPEGLVSGLANALCALLDDPERRRSMGLAGRRRATAVYDRGVVLGRIRELHERIGVGQ